MFVSDVTGEFDVGVCGTDFVMNPSSKWPLEDSFVLGSSVSFCYPGGCCFSAYFIFWCLINMSATTSMQIFGLVCLLFLKYYLLVVLFPLTVWWHSKAADWEKEGWLVSVSLSWVILTWFQNLVCFLGRNIHLKQWARRPELHCDLWMAVNHFCVCV